jgi:hypothetical protein
MIFNTSSYARSIAPQKLANILLNVIYRSHVGHVPLAYKETHLCLSVDYHVPQYYTARDCPSPGYKLQCLCESVLDMLRFRKYN